VLAALFGDEAGEQVRAIIGTDGDDADDYDNDKDVSGTTDAISS